MQDVPLNTNSKEALLKKYWSLVVGHHWRHIVCHQRRCIKLILDKITNKNLFLHKLQNLLQRQSQNPKYKIIIEWNDCFQQRWEINRFSIIHFWTLKLDIYTIDDSFHSTIFLHHSSLAALHGDNFWYQIGKACVDSNLPRARK